MRGNPPRHARDKQSDLAPAGPWTNRFVKCHHCGGSHWHRDCPKRHKSKDSKVQQGLPLNGCAALAGADAIADKNLDAAIGNVLLAANAQPRSFESDGHSSLRAQPGRRHRRRIAAHLRRAYD
eukprot:6185867-Pleurochrysis_carterae.AAC.1